MTPEQMAAAGITRRQIELWIARGWVRPVVHGKGNEREWPAVETRIALLMGRLVHLATFPPATAADIARERIEHGGPVTLAPGLILHIDLGERRPTPPSP